MEEAMEALWSAWEQDESSALEAIYEFFDGMASAHKKSWPELQQAAIRARTAVADVMATMDE